MPGLSRLSQEGRWIAWIDPPHLPYAPALAALGVRLSRVLLVRSASVSDRLWAVEQALGSGACGAVLSWIGECEDRRLRRLQLAAERGGAWGFLFRLARFADRPSPAALRLKVEPAPSGLTVQSLKGRGGRLTLNLNV
jgi:cell division inhibitor SulA/protein ImuA